MRPFISLLVVIMRSSQSALLFLNRTVSLFKNTRVQNQVFNFTIGLGPGSSPAPGTVFCLKRLVVSFTRPRQARVTDLYKARSLHTSSSLFAVNDDSPADSNTKSKSKTKIGQMEMQPRMAIQFTCKVCNHRNTKTFPNIAYVSGIVIVECGGCKNRHLIADNLGWFNHIQGR